MQKRIGMQLALKPIAVVVAAMLGALAVIVVYQPGAMSPDSLSQFVQASTGELSDWHPPLMAFVWSVLLNIAPGPFGMLVWHQLLFWSGVAVVVLALRFGPLASALLVLAIGLFPPVFGLLGVVWKDVGMGAALTLAVGFILLGKRVGSPVLLGAAFVPLLYAVAMRYNALPAVIPLVVWAVYEILRLRQALSKTVLGLASAGLVLAMLFISLGLTRVLVEGAPTWRGTATLQASLIHDLAGVAVQTDQVRFPAYAFAGDLPLTVELLRDLYRPDTLDLIVFHPELREQMISPGTQSQLPELVRTWWAVIRASPTEYVNHRLAALGTIFDINKSYYAFHEGIAPNSIGLTFNRSAIYEAVIDALRATQWLFFRGWIYLLGAVAILIAGIVKRRPRSAWIAASGIAYVVPYAFISTGAGFRYIWWMVVATILGAVVLLDEIRHSDAEGASGSQPRIG